MSFSTARLAGRPITALLQPFQATGLVTPVASAAFSTSSALAATAVASTSKVPKRPVRKNYKKGRVIAHVNKPAPGERKAFRKRIILSNNNALEVTGESVVDVAEGVLANEEHVGKMIKLSDKVIDRLRVMEVFKTTQGWKMFRSPHVLLRKQAVEFLKRIDKAGQEKTAVRTLLAGDRISGKSILNLEALTHAMLNKWVVVHIPEAMELTNASTEYAPLADNPNMFYQSTYTQALIQRILTANDHVLRTIPLQNAYPGLTPNLAHLTPQTSTLHDLLASCKESEFAWTTLSTFWTELTTIPGRPPVLLSADGAAHFLKTSAYLSPEMKHIHAHDLTVPRLFIDALSGATPLVNGGAVLATLSTSGRMNNSSLDLKLAQGIAKNNGQRVPGANPWEKGYDARVDAALKDVEVLEVDHFDKEETRAIMEYWAASGLLRERVDSVAVANKWTLGSGVVGEIEKMALRNMRM